MSPLKNPRHEQFARLVAAGETPARAYIAVGYQNSDAASSSGSRLAKTPNVRARIAELQEESARGAIKRNELNQDWVLARLKENVERAMQATPVRDSEGNPTGEYKWEGNVVNRSLELIGKELGMFRDRVEMNVDAKVQTLSVTLAQTLTSGELRALEQRLMAAQQQRARAEAQPADSGEQQRQVGLDGDDDLACQ